MAISLKDLKSSTAMLPPRVLIYGPPGLGKTSLLAQFPNPISIDVERGKPADVDLITPGDDFVYSYDSVMELIGQLYTEEHDFLTVGLDTLDRFEPLIWAKACADNNWSNIEDPGYGKGYVAADRYWRELIEGLNALRRDRGMNIVLLAHSTIDRFDSPTSAPYSRYDIRLHKRAVAIVQDEVDAILFVNQDATIKADDVGFNKKHTRAEGGGTRWIYCEGRPAFTAKNRYALPDKVMFQKGEGFDALISKLPISAPAAVAAPAKKKAA